MSAPPAYHEVEKGGPPEGHPPQQAGYPPQQAGYPPQQAGYPPQQPGYPPQQPGYPPQQQGAYPPPQGGPQAYPQPTSTTHVTVVQAGAPVFFRDGPIAMTCPFCHANTQTNVTREVGGLAWLLCVIMLFVGFWPCSFIPFCIPDCQDCVHTCANCHRQVGKYNRL